MITGIHTTNITGAGLSGPPGTPSASSKAADSPFSDLLTDAIGKVSQLEDQARAAVDGLMTGAGAGQVLGSHLAGLNAHMTNQYEHLNPVTLSTPDASSSRDAGREMGQGNGAGTSQERQQQQMQEDPEFARIEPIARSAGGLAEEPQSDVPTQIFTAGPNPFDGHVSFVV